MERNKHSQAWGKGKERCTKWNRNSFPVEPCKHHNILQPFLGWRHFADRIRICKW